jgi:hypothetical protein
MVHGMFKDAEIKDNNGMATSKGCPRREYQN